MGACISSDTNTHPYKGPPVTCTMLFVKHLDEGTVSGRFFYNADDMLNVEWTALNPLTLTMSQNQG